MKKEELLESFCFLDDELIERSEKKSSHIPWQKWTGAAACLVLVAGALFASRGVWLQPDLPDSQGLPADVSAQVAANTADGTEHRADASAPAQSGEEAEEKQWDAAYAPAPGEKDEWGVSALDGAAVPDDPDITETAFGPIPEEPVNMGADDGDRRPAPEDVAKIEDMAKAKPYLGTELTEAEARADSEFGAYLCNPPSGFDEAEFRRTEGELLASFRSGYAYVEWYVRKAGENDFGRLVEDVSRREDYDLSLYTIPYSESVPEDKWEIVNDPVFRSGDLTLDAVYARTVSSGELGDGGGARITLSVLCGDTIVRVITKGVSPEWLYGELSALG